MSSTIIQTHASRESYTTLESILLHQCPRALFYVLHDLRCRHSRADILPCPLSHLTMDLSSASYVIICRFRILIHELFIISRFLRSDSVGIANFKVLGFPRLMSQRNLNSLVFIRLKLSLLVDPIREKFRQSHSRRLRLLQLLLLGLFLLFLLLCFTFRD